MKTSISNLKSKGFVNMEYPQDLRQAVHTAVDSWKRFYSLPTDLKKDLPYSNNTAGVGYELKEGVGKNADHKENFDVTIGGKEWLEKHITHINNPIALEFVRNAVALVEVMKPIILDFAQQAENEFHLKGFVKEVEESKDAFFVRFIHYFGDRAVGDEIASAHPDQSGFTLHLFESSPGLQCLTFDRQWIDMPVSEGETVIIPSMQLQLCSQGELKALCHRVVATQETAQNGRYSAVCFVQLKRTAKYDKESHGRLQEKTPGFNYDMTHEEFAKLFKV